MSVKGGPNTVTNGLVLELDAGNIKSYQSGSTTWFDKSGFANNGTLVNGPTFNSGSNGSIVFDGVDDYIQLVNSTTYKTQFPLTVSTWVNVQTLANYGVLIRTDNTSDAHWGVALIVGNSYELAISYGNGTSNDSNGRRTYATSTSLINTNTWYNCVTVLPDSLTCNGYINGSAVSMPYVSGNATTLVYGSGGGTMGFRTDTPGASYFKGNISQTQVYNRALSADEVLQNYNATKGRFGIV
jgi:hypothetical protein